MTGPGQSATDEAAIRRLIGEVAAKHGIRLDADDPAFAIVTLNQLMLEESLKRAMDAFTDLPIEWEKASQRIQTRTGAAIGEEVKAALAAIKEAGDRAQRLATGGSTHRLWVAAGAVAAAALFATGFVVGKLL